MNFRFWAQKNRESSDLETKLEAVEEVCRMYKREVDRLSDRELSLRTRNYRLELMLDKAEGSVLIADAYIDELLRGTSPRSEEAEFRYTEDRGASHARAQAQELRLKQART